LVVKRIAALLLGLCATPAAAEEYIAFRSPTGNIHCSLYQWDGTTTVRCDLREYAPSYTKAPPNCEYDWGMSFAVDATGKGYLACVSDSMVDPGNPVLPYGQAVSLGGISCVSAKTGMTCTNAAGHGFSVAKAKQKLF
jgi:hypothetical protein